MVHEGTPPAGEKIGPGDRRYTALSRGFNPRWVAEPEYIRLVSSGEEVKNALAAAVAETPKKPERSRITVRSGGHCYENFVCSPDVRVIIDVSLMNGIHYDPAMQAVCVEAGATNRDIEERLVGKLGLALPGGSCPTVGAGGHIPGGGFGLLSRQFGLTVDYLHAVEVAVVTDKREVELVTATADDTGDRKDLWWAHTGGGGGNFGIATRFWFRGLPAAPAEVIRAEVGWKWADMGKDDFHKLVDNFGRFFEEHRGQSGDAYAALFGILQLTHSSKEQIGLITQIDAAVPDAERRVAEFIDKVGHGVGPRPLHMAEGHGEHASIVNSKDPVAVPWHRVAERTGVATNDRAGKYKSAYMLTRLPTKQVDAVWRGLTENAQKPRDALVQIDSYGSKINEKSADATAMAQRSSIMKLQHQAYWPIKEGGTDHLRWIRELYQDMYRDTGGVPVSNAVTDGCYINYPDVDVRDKKWNTSGVSWSTLYYGANYPRLQRAKKRWDPHNIFHHRESIGSGD
ncbi:MAG: FAD-binding protein [Nocardiopsaceae bacterium]|nr:FAD-binding protein [Nocardiopsaceae bacterium]